jgi:RNA polymerase sigma-70 factor (ECF subfamily)
VSSQAPDDFATTHWSLVVRLGNRGHAQADAALAWLCERYWRPLYLFVRRSGYEPHDAEDLVQSFFARLLEKDVLAAASPDRGRFRTFLLAAMKNFLANEWDRGQALKRGGGRGIASLDVASVESQWVSEPAHAVTADRVYEQQWAMTLLELVASKLAAEFTAAGRGRQFELLKGAITAGDRALPYNSLAEELGMTEEAVRQSASRLRKRYRELLRAEVADTVADPGEVDDEIRSLFALFES